MPTGLNKGTYWPHAMAGRSIQRAKMLRKIENVQLIILSINTSTKQYSLALLENEIVVGEYLLSSGSSHFRNLMPCVDDLFRKTTLTPGQLGAVTVSIGPGSFTGTRVGLAVAKGLSQGLGIPIIGVSTLPALASQIPYASTDICSLVTSRKGEVFAALFRRDHHDNLIRIEEDVSLRMEELPALIKRKTIIIGNDFTAQSLPVEQYAGENALFAPPNLWNLRASSIGALGFQRLKQGESDNISTLVPLYLRDADIRSGNNPLG
jgi:tRNA threonylcarbamoyladenosine biosynthesis protein TsaB